MEYKKTSWVDGSTPVDASRLNNLEDGVATLAEEVSELNDSVNEILSTTYWYMGAKAEIIPVDADLNDYLTIGTYRCTSNSNAASLQNCPSTTAFGLLVFSSEG